MLYQQLFKHAPLRRFMLLGNLLAIVLQSSQLVLVTRLNVAWGLNDKLFVLGGDGG